MWLSKETEEGMRFRIVADAESSWQLQPDNGRGTSQPPNETILWRLFLGTAEEQELGQCVKIRSPTEILVANWRGAVSENTWFLACLLNDF